MMSTTVCRRSRSGSNHLQCIKFPCGSCSKWGQNSVLQSYAACKSHPCGWLGCRNYSCLHVRGSYAWIVRQILWRLLVILHFVELKYGLLNLSWKHSGSPCWISVGSAVANCLLSILGQHVTVYVFTWRCRQEVRRDERQGYGIRLSQYEHS